MRQLHSASQANHRTTEAEEARSATLLKRPETVGFLALGIWSVAKADYFCTCDDRLMRKARGLTGLDTKVVSPVELVMELTDELEAKPMSEITAELPKYYFKEWE